MKDLLLTALHSSAFAITTDGVIATDDRRSIVLFSMGAEQIFGHSASSVLGQPLEILVPERFRSRHSKFVADFSESRETVRTMSQRMEITALHKDGHEFPCQAAIAQVQAESKKVLTAVIRDITLQKHQEQRVQAVMQELDHRVRNVITRLSAVIELTGANANSTTEYKDALLSRLDSIARAHVQLSHSTSGGVTMKELISDQTHPYGHENSIVLEGPEVRISADAAQSMTMIVHELVTNAVKHGALAAQAGFVRVAWMVEAPADRITWSWQETGVVGMREPSTTGLGLTLIRQLVARELRGDVDFSFALDGLRCAISAPLSHLANGRP